MRKIFLPFLLLPAVIANTVLDVEVVGPSDTYISSFGVNVTLMCTVINHTTGNVKWFRIEPADYDEGGGPFCTITKDGMLVACLDIPQYANFAKDFVISDTSNQYNIKIIRLGEKDLGEYSCYYGTSEPTSGAILALAERPSVVEISNSAGGEVEVIEGVARTLTCTAYDSKSQVSIQWTIDGSSVAEDSTNFTKNSNGTFTTTSYKTHTYSHTIHHGKPVGCVATNVAGTSFTNVTLNVLVSASITNPSENNVYADEGDEAVLKCEAEGNPPPDFKWAKDSTVITGGEDHIDLDESDPGGFDRNSTLTINPVDSERDFGNYTCIATNSHGNDILTINLDVKTAPEPATGISVTDATDTALTVTWVEGQDGGYLQSFTVQYRVDGSGEDTWMVSEKVDHPPVTLTGLQPLTQYEIRVRSDNTLGSVHSHPITANTTATLTTLTTTLAAAVPEPATGVNVTSVTDTKLSVTWTEGEDGGNHQYFTAEYKMNKSDEDWKDSQTVDHPPVTLTNLLPLTKYEIRVKSFNTLGHVYSESIVFTTDPSLSTSPIILIIGICIGIMFLIAIIVSILIFRKKTEKVSDNQEPESMYATPQQRSYEPVYAGLIKDDKV